MKKGLIKNSFYHPDKKEIPFKRIILRSLIICTILFGCTIISTYLNHIEDIDAEGESMNPTFDYEVALYLNSTDKVLNSLTYHDIIQFNVNNEAIKDENYVKRIIALPGDYIEMKDGKLFINDEYVEEDFIIPDNTPIERRLLGEDEYFVMGDNRANSDDSRFIAIGVVHKSQIKGRIFGGSSKLSSDTYDFIKFHN